MNQNQSIRLIKQLLQTVPYASLATVTSDGAPWNSPVRYVYDDKLNIYWFSNKDSQHSHNIRDSGQVFIAIYDSAVPEGKGRGLYIKAKARELEDRDEIWAARMLVDQAVRRTPDDFIGTARRRAYTATPECIWTNHTEHDDKGATLADYRIEVPLADLAPLTTIYTPYK